MFYHSQCANHQKRSTVHKKNKYKVKQSFDHTQYKNRLGCKENTDDEKVLTGNSYSTFNMTKNKLKKFCLVLAKDDIVAFQNLLHTMLVSMSDRTNQCLRTFSSEPKVLIRRHRCVLPRERTRPVVQDKFVCYAPSTFSGHRLVKKQKLLASLLVLAFHYNATKCCTWLFNKDKCLLSISYDETVELYQTLITISKKLVHVSSTEFLISTYKFIIQSQCAHYTMIDSVLMFYCCLCTACYYNNVELINLIVNTNQILTTKRILSNVIYTTNYWQTSDNVIYLPMVLAILSRSTFHTNSKKSHSVSTVALLCTLLEKHKLDLVLENEIRQACCFGYMDIVKELYHYQALRYTKTLKEFHELIYALVIESCRYYQYGVATLLIKLSKDRKMDMLLQLIFLQIAKYSDKSREFYLPLTDVYHTHKLAHQTGFRSLDTMPILFLLSNSDLNSTRRYKLIQSWNCIERIIQYMSSHNVSSQLIIILQDIVQRQLEVNIAPLIQLVPEQLPQWTGTVREWLKQIIPMMGLECI